MICLQVRPHSFARRRRSVNGIVALAICWLAPALSAVEPTRRTVEEAAEWAPGHFVYTGCLEYAKNERARHDVVMALERIARRPPEKETNTAAVRAMLHIGGRTPETMECLYRIVVDLYASYGARTVAAEYLVLWSNDFELRRRLLPEVEKNWRTGSTASLPLREFGDDGYLCFLRRTIAELDGDDWDGWLKNELAYTSAVNELPEGNLVELFLRVAPRWQQQSLLLQAAIRKGVDRSTLREAANTYVSREQEDLARTVEWTGFLARCFDLCVFTDGDEALFPTIFGLRAKLLTIHPDYASVRRRPAWATLGRELLDEFYRENGFCEEPEESWP